MSKKVDPFANLMASTQLPQKQIRNMSLAEQQQKKQPPLTKEVVSANDLDSFFNTTPQTSPQKAAVQPNVAKYQTVVEDDPFGIFAASPSPAKSPQSIAQPIVQPTPPLDQHLDPAFEQQPKFVQQEPTVPVQQQKQEQQPVKQTDPLAKMIELGFTAKESEVALKQSGGDMTEAINQLLNGTKTQSPQKEQPKDQFNKLMGKAQVIGGGLFQKAKVMVNEQSKKLTTAIQNAQKAQEERRSSLGKSRESIEAIEPQKPLPQTPTQIERPVRPTSQNPAPQQVVQQAAQVKDQGTTVFKAGQYGDAEELYSKSIDLLRSFDDVVAQLIPLYNNRAACRLKTGVYDGAIEDASVVIDYVLKEAEYRDPCMPLSDLNDAQAKAYLRRATAYENKEKWTQAQSDYQKCMQLASEQGQQAARLVTDGLRRCQQTLNPQPVQVPVSKPVVKKQVQVKVDVLADLHSMVQEPAKADIKQPTQQELQTKDKTDSLILKWKNGKDQNLRALLSTLDQILVSYPAIMSNNGGWKTPQMSELVTASQVKIKYMKAIAKVHPDKVGSCSPEEVIICQNVFSSLNAAWDVFKAQNGM